MREPVLASSPSRRDKSRHSNRAATAINENQNPALTTANGFSIITRARASNYRMEIASGRLAR